VAIAHDQLLSDIDTTGTYVLVLGFFSPSPEDHPFDSSGQAEGEADICVILGCVHTQTTNVVTGTIIRALIESPNAVFHRVLSLHIRTVEPTFTDSRPAEIHQQSAPNNFRRLVRGCDWQSSR
jgi:hypothetical protein